MNVPAYFDPHAFLIGMLHDLQDEVYAYETANLRLIYANKAACTRCGWQNGTLSERTIAESSSIFNIDAFHRYVAPLLSGEREVVRIETEHETGPVEVTTRLSEGPNGVPIFVSVLRDRSERKRLDLARMESFSEISHEMRTPLTSIKGSLHLLENGALGELPGPAREVLTLALRNTGRLLGIVNDILDFQKIAAGKVDMTRESVDLARLVEEAVEANRGYGAEHHVALVYEGPGGTAPVFAHAEQLMQVMANLLSNAVKHSPVDETVRVRLSDAGESWRVSVRDCGPGIPEAVGERLFQSFAQAVPRDGRTRGGTGLGLAISRKLVRLHHGEIGYDSRPGEGTRFFFTLPKPMAEAGVAAE